MVYCEKEALALRSPFPRRAGGRKETPVLLIMTSNAPDTAYRELLENYRRTLSRFVGPARVFVSGDTLQLRDYGATDWPWTMFDPARKLNRHEEVFPEERKRAFALGKELCD